MNLCPLRESGSSPGIVFNVAVSKELRLISGCIVGPFSSTVSIKATPVREVKLVPSEVPSVVIRRTSGSAKGLVSIDTNSAYSVRKEDATSRYSPVLSAFLWVGNVSVLGGRRVVLGGENRGVSCSKDKSDLSSNMKL